MNLLIKASIRIVGAFALCVAFAYGAVRLTVGATDPRAPIGIAVFGAIVCIPVIVAYYLDMKEDEEHAQQK